MKVSILYDVFISMLLSVVIGFLVYGTKLFSSEPLSIHLSDTYFVYVRSMVLLPVFILVFLLVRIVRYKKGKRAIPGN